MNNKRINETEKLTTERLKKFEGFENIKEKEAEEIIKSYDLFASILFGYFQEQILKT